jgi:hypothetical protein
VDENAGCPFIAGKSKFALIYGRACFCKKERYFILLACFIELGK